MQSISPRSSPGLDPVTVERLWRAWKTDGDLAARNQLVVGFTYLVKVIATRQVRLVPAHCEIDDLISVGHVGLIAAIDGWDPQKGASFEQYCWTRIRGAMRDELRRIDWAPRSVRRSSRMIDRARDKVQLREGRLPTEIEVAREAEMTVEELRVSLERVSNSQLISLSVMVDPTGEDPIELGESVVDPALDAEPVMRAITRERISLIAEAVRALPSRERTALEMVCFGAMPGVEAAARLGVSESRVSQLVGSARARVRRQLLASE